MKLSSLFSKGKNHGTKTPRNFTEINNNDVADDFDYEAELATEKMVTFLQPLMIIILGFVIGTIIISVILPMYTLYGSIGA